MEHVISISPTGHIKAMHNDRFPMGFLGQQSIVRASEIVWQESPQHWAIMFNVDGAFMEPSEEYTGFDSYDAARSFEVAVMNHCMKEQMKPTDAEIRRWAAQQKS